MEVSIPQSGFLVVTPVGVINYRALLKSVSIPQSGFLVVTLGPKPLTWLARGGFNPSVGILGGHTMIGFIFGKDGQTFQSLSRDSWWSHKTDYGGQPQINFVSIPQSGFLVVTLQISLSVVNVQ